MAELFAALGDDGIAIYLDTSVIRRHPDLLSSKRKGLDLVVLNVVEREIEANSPAVGRIAALKKLLSESVDKRVVRRERATPIPAETIPVRSLQRLSGVDRAILYHLIYRRSKSPAILVTNDRELADAVHSAGITVLGARDFYSQWLNFELQSDPALERLGYRVQVWGIFGSILLYSLGTLLLYVAVANIDVVLNVTATIGPWIYGALAVIVAVMAFALRARALYEYGAAECWVGVAAIASGVIKSVSSANISDLFAALLGVAAGAYIIVRGLDNMDRGDPPDRVRTVLDWLKGP